MFTFEIGIHQEIHESRKEYGKKNKDPITQAERHRILSSCINYECENQKGGASEEGADGLSYQIYFHLFCLTIVYLGPDKNTTPQFLSAYHAHWKAQVLTLKLRILLPVLRSVPFYHGTLCGSV